jgi:hypothetical protein
MNPDYDKILREYGEGAQDFPLAKAPEGDVTSIP